MLIFKCRQEEPRVSISSLSCDSRNGGLLRLNRRPRAAVDQYLPGQKAAKQVKRTLSLLKPACNSSTFLLTEVRILDLLSVTCVSTAIYTRDKENSRHMNRLCHVFGRLAPPCSEVTYLRDFLGVSFPLDCVTVISTFPIRKYEDN